MEHPKKVPGDSYVQSLARGLAVIRTFGQEAPHQTLSEVAAKAGLDRAGARRLLLTLESLGYVRRQGRDFFPTPRILDLGYSYLSTVPWWSIAESKMVELVDTVNESATLGVLDGTHIVLIACVHSRNVLNINLAVARRSPAYCTSMGRVLLGGLPEKSIVRTLNESNLIKYQSSTTTSIPELLRIIQHDREQGWSVISQEYEESVCSISVPLFSRTGQMLAAICVVGTPTRTSPKQMIETILPKLKMTAKKVWE